MRLPDRISRDPTGELEDVAIAVTGFRLERMSDTHWWMELARPDGSRLTINMAIPTGRPRRIVAVDHSEPPNT